MAFERHQTAKTRTSDAAIAAPLVIVHMTNRILRRLTALLVWLAAAWAVPAVAHWTPNSEVRLEIGHAEVRLDIIIPQGDYAYATGNPVGNSREASNGAKDYLARNLAARSAGGEPWTVSIETAEFVHIAGPPDLHATATLLPPQGASTRSFLIDWTAVVDSLPGHFALFVVRRDALGRIGDEREIVGAARQGRTTVAIERGPANPMFALGNAMLLGIHHIIEGYDHLLFLLALLLPAPLIARAGRWHEAKPLRGTALLLLKIVTAFTIGHSFTLIGATLWNPRLPAATVEVAIAISVLVSAVHAMRPIFPRREPLIALGFGLVHGLAFATLLAEADVAGAQGALALLGFNLGIEVVQIAIVALTAPPLVMLSRSAAFGPIRIGLAALTSLAALAWIINRTTGNAAAFVESLEGTMSLAPWAIAALMAAALCTWAQRRGQA